MKGSVVSDESPLLYAVEKHIATITFNRPHRMNAQTPEMKDGLYERLVEADADGDVRVIVLTGAGNAFCAGADVDWMNDTSVKTRKRTWSRDALDYEMLPMQVRKPMIAAINGACAGVGLVYALMCDLRFVATDARISTAFARRGLIAEHGGSWLLPRIVGLSNALDLLLSARKIDGVEAGRLGLANRVCRPEELMSEVLAYANELVQYSSPRSMAIIKSQLHRHIDTDYYPAVLDSNQLVNEALKSEDYQEGVASFLEKRQPKFPPLPPAKIERC